MEGGVEYTLAEVKDVMNLSSSCQLKRTRQFDTSAIYLSVKLISSIGSSSKPSGIVRGEEAITGSFSSCPTGSSTGLVLSKTSPWELLRPWSSDSERSAVGLVGAINLLVCNVCDLILAWESKYGGSNRVNDLDCKISGRPLAEPSEDIETLIV